MMTILKTTALALMLSLAATGAAIARDGGKSASDVGHSVGKGHNKHEAAPTESTGGSGAGTVDTGGSCCATGGTTDTSGTGAGSLDTGGNTVDPSYSGSSGGVTGGSAETSFEPAGSN